MPERTCAVEGCDRPYRAKGLCKKHYYELRPEKCTVEGCRRPLRARGCCMTHYRALATATARHCEGCGSAFVADQRSRFCSSECRYYDRRGPMRRAVDNGDPAGIVLAARESSTVTASGCWEWQFAKSIAGYPMIGQGGRGGLVHRHVAAAVAGRDIGKEPVHHKCANPSCVNPEHLQLTTHRENLAEMLKRNFYVRRIAELEAALMELAPDHPAVTGG